MISLEDWALIRRLVADGVSRRQVARDLGISRGTVERALASSAPPAYRRAKSVTTAFTPYELAVRRLLETTPTMPATVLAERVGWTGSITWFRDNLRPIRRDYTRVDPADRLTWDAGDAIQCDLWFPPAAIALEDGSTPSLPVLVMTCAYSRHAMALLLPTRTTDDLIGGMWQLLNGLGAVPRRLIWDNEAGIGRGKTNARGIDAFTGTLATRLHRLRPYDPESKGLIERITVGTKRRSCPGASLHQPKRFPNPAR